MLLERTLSTLQTLGNERLQLPIFYESPLSLRFEIGPEDIPVNDPRYFRMAYWRTSFLYEKAPAFDTLLWVLYRTPDMDSDINELLDPSPGFSFSGIWKKHHLKPPPCWTVS